MHRALLLLGLVALAPLAGGLEPREMPLERASVVPAAPAPCVPLLEARAQPSHVALSWTPCLGVERYQLLRGPSAAELRPIVEVNHPGHVDVGARPPTVAYAVRAVDGPLSAAVVVALG